MSQTSSFSSSNESNSVPEIMPISLNQDINLKEAESFLHFARKNTILVEEDQFVIGIQNELSSLKNTDILVAMSAKAGPNKIEKYKRPVVPKTLPKGVFWTTKIEAGINRYLCPAKGCDKSFTRPQNLKSHYLAHTGEKPFCCPDCDRPFQRRSDLKRHGKIHLAKK
jgi:uncharacterized Zn-finger protein